jgi:hypothetical protein
VRVCVCVPTLTLVRVSRVAAGGRRVQAELQHLEPHLQQGGPGEVHGTCVCAGMCGGVSWGAAVCACLTVCVSGRVIVCMRYIMCMHACMHANVLIVCVCALMGGCILRCISKLVRDWVCGCAWGHLGVGVRAGQLCFLQLCLTATPWCGHVELAWV